MNLEPFLATLASTVASQRRLFILAAETIIPKGKVYSVHRRGWAFAKLLIVQLLTNTTRSTLAGFVNPRFVKNY